MRHFATTPIYIFSALFATALACSPSGGNGGNSGGEIGDNAYTNEPTFKLTLQPPLAWTYPVDSDAFYDGQSKTKKIADLNAKNSVKSAYFTGFARANALPTPGQDLDLSLIEGIKINIVNNTAPAAAKDGIDNGGTVTDLCDAVKDDGCTLSTFEADQSFTVLNGPFLSGKQWKDVATSIMTALMLEDVNFPTAEIKVSA